MEADSFKFEVQTEGLGEFWGVAPDYRERRTRTPMTADELDEIIATILLENGNEAKGLFIIERSKKSIHIRLNDGIIELSDPNDANHQNIAISQNDLKASLLDFFGLEKATKEVHKSQVIFLEWLIAAVAGAGMLIAVYFALQHLNRERDFMPQPEFMEVSDQVDFKNHLSEIAGIYVTGLQDGETLLNLTEGGMWEFYDLERMGSNSFSVSLVEKGYCRPVYQKGKLAMLTDVNYLFFWESEGVLRFQERTYTRTAREASDVSYITFPE